MGALPSLSLSLPEAPFSKMEAWRLGGLGRAAIVLGTAKALGFPDG